MARLNPNIVPSIVIHMTPPEPSPVKSRLLRLLLYIIVGFAAAFIYHYFKK